MNEWVFPDDSQPRKQLTRDSQPRTRFDIFHSTKIPKRHCHQMYITLVVYSSYSTDEFY